MEHFLAWIAIVVALLSPFGSLVLYNVKSNRKKGRDEARLDKLEETVANHEKDEFPHKDCAIHATKLDYLCTTVGEIKESIGTLDQRIYDKFQNGGKSASIGG